MLKVKLKLLYVLNAFMSLGMVEGRPHAELNTTSTSTGDSKGSYTLPVDPSYDTLVVASDAVTPEEARSFKTQLDDIVNAEQDRDEALSEKVMKDQVSFLGIRKQDAEGLEKQLNTSSTLLDKLIDSETDREETLTDILSGSDSELVQDAPKYEFLLATQSANASDHPRHVNNLSQMGREAYNITKKLSYVELVEDKTSSRKIAHNLTMSRPGHDLDNDLAPDTRFTDMQTLMMAGLATLVPLIGLLLMILSVRAACMECYNDVWGSAIDLQLPQNAAINMTISRHAWPTFSRGSHRSSSCEFAQAVAPSRPGANDGAS